MTIIIYNEGPFHTSVRSFFPEPSKHFFPPLIEWIMGTSLLTSMVRSCCAIGCETAPRIGQFTWSGSAGLSAGETVFQLAFSIINTHARTHAPLSIKTSTQTRFSTLNRNFKPIKPKPFLSPRGLILMPLFLVC